MTKLPARSVRTRPSNHWFVRLLLPIECLDCGREGDWLCPVCQNDLVVSRPTICVICAKAGSDGLCTRCRTKTGLQGIVSLFPYHSQSIQRLVRAVKFGGQFDALRFFAWRYGTEIGRRLPTSAPFVPVPLSQKRLQHRGFNQAAFLAEQLARHNESIWLGLTRSRETAAQAELDAKSRLQNVRGAFTSEQNPGISCAVLVDDVVTTGATLTECARALRKAGVTEIWAVTIAHG